MRNLFLVIFCTIALVSCNIESPEEVESEFIGKWILSSSEYPEDSSFVHNTLVTLNADSIFTSNSAFFLRYESDSIRKMPFNGHWSIQVPGVIGTVISNGRMPNRLVIKKDTSTNYICGIMGSASQGKMYWCENDESLHTLYTWSLVKEN